MKSIVKKAIVAAAASAAIAGSLIGFTTTSASAIDIVPCDSPDFVHLTVHPTNGSDFEMCFANGGEYRIPQTTPNGPKLWVTKITTGNNHVLYWAGDDYEPSELKHPGFPQFGRKFDPIPPRTTYVWGNHPGGVELKGIKIV